MVVSAPRVPYLPLLANLWKSYTSVTPKAAKIHLLLSEEKQLNVVNDHIAFRTISHPTVGLQALGSLFEQLGFVARGDYVFEDKHLTAKHYEYAHNTSDSVPAPKIFISQLELDQMSPFVKDTLLKQIEKIPTKVTECWDILTYGAPEGAPDYAIYEKLLEESEYAAWFYVYGYVPNHFTISVNHLWRLNDPEKKSFTLPELNDLIEKQEHPLSRPNGQSIQGTPENLLQQSSTLAEPREVEFSDGVVRTIPSCYYEFAYRYEDPKTRDLYQGFVTKNADKLFESTNVKKSV